MDTKKPKYLLYRVFHEHDPSNKVFKLEHEEIKSGDNVGKIFSFARKYMDEHDDVHHLEIAKYNGNVYYLYCTIFPDNSDLPF